MNFELILKDLKPSQDEIDAVSETSDRVIDFINETCKEEKINAKAMAVGSVAKKTWLSGKSDIDIFIHFPTSVDMDYLKETGLYLAYKTNNALNGKASEHYASHPYLTCDIDGFEVDIVPCYEIEEGESIISAVDRTILHTKYIKKNLDTEEKQDEVLLLKKFMDSVGTYGSEFKTGGFAGYLCELLILEYGSFENTLRAAQNWKFNTEIDLENFGTAKDFKQDPLVCIDPTDKNRNVGAALRIERFVDFIVASRNFLAIADDNDLDEKEKQEKINEFFKPLKKEHLLDKSNEEVAKSILESFKDRQTQTLILKFKIPENISADALHPQLLKTVSSICEKIEMEEFSVFKYDYWTDEERFVIFTIELNVFYYIHKGPKVWPKKACDNFKKKWQDALYPLDEFMVLTREREFKTAKEFLEKTLDDNHIHIFKIGKNIKEAICSDECVPIEIDEFLNDLNTEFDYGISNKTGDELAKDYLNSLDDFLNPGQYIKR